MHHSLAAIIAFFAATAALAAPPKLAFQPAEKDTYVLDTGVLRGHLRLGGKNQGISALVDKESGLPIAADLGGGLLGYYRIFSTDTRYGDAARDWPTVAKLLPDGAVEVRWPATQEHPLELTAVYRIAAADTIDVETIVRPQRAMPGFEVFLASYFRPGFRAAVYVKPNSFARGKPEFLAADVNPLVDGSYLMFPRDRAAVQMIFDRRWERPPHPVQWSVTRWLAAPIAIRRHEPSGLTAVIMAPPDDCFAIAAPYNKTPPDGVSAHNSLYLSLFGRDLAAGQTARAHTRMVVAGKLTDQQVVERYEKYVKERQ